MKVVFLLDKSNNWIEPYIQKYIAESKNNYSIHYDHSELIGNEIVFILGYTKILDKNFLDQNKLNLVVHESDLPYGKGFSPIQWQILEGKNEITFTLFEATENVDAGAIYAQKNVNFSGYELFDEIRSIQGEKTIELIREFIERYPNVSKKQQIGSESIYPRRTNEDDRLNAHKTIKEQFNHFRIANNNDYPLWFEIDGHKYIIKIFEDKQ